MKRKCAPLEIQARQNLRKGSLTGFTLLEILLVVIIIASIVGMVLPRLSGRSEQANVMAAKVDITSNVATALKMYELDNADFPTTDQGLDALLKKSSIPPIPKNWNGPYLDNPPIDPWGRPYLYRYPGSHGFAYDLYSLGRNNIDDETNIVNWE